MIKGLILQDFYILRKQSSLLVIVFALINIFMILVQSNTAMICTSSFVILYQCGNIFAFEEKYNFNNCLYTTPVSKQQVVLGKYITFGLFDFIVLMCNIAIVLVASYISKIDVIATIGICIMSSLSMLLAHLVLIPKNFKYGYITNANGVITLALVAGFFGGFSALGIEIMDIINFENSMFIWAGIGIILVVIATYISYKVSVSIMLKKEA